MTKRFEREWGLFSAVVIPASASPVQVQEMRRAFYGGAQTLLALITGSLTPGTEPQDEDLKLMDELNQELKEFVAKVKRGEA